MYAFTSKESIPNSNRYGIAECIKGSNQQYRIVRTENSYLKKIFIKLLNLQTSDIQNWCYDFIKGIIIKDSIIEANKMGP